MNPSDDVTTVSPLKTSLAVILWGIIITFYWFTKRYLTIFMRKGREVHEHEQEGEMTFNSDVRAILHSNLCILAL